MQKVESFQEIRNKTLEAWWKVIREVYLYITPKSKKSCSDL